MKATIVLIANTEAENFGKKLMLKAHRYGNLGFEMARLPQHISLKQPFKIPDLKSMESFFDEFVKNIFPIDIEFECLELFPTKVLGGFDSGCLTLRVKKTQTLENIQKRLNEELTKKFGPCPAEHDDDYIFHMTFAIGGGDFISYQKTYEKLKNDNFIRKYRFDKLGLLFYDNDNIFPGTYFCYKIKDL